MMQRSRGLLIITCQALLAAVVLSAAASASAQQEPAAGNGAAAAAGTHLFFVGCPDNLAGTPHEGELERKQSKWFFKAKMLKSPLRFEVTYSTAVGGNGTACEPTLGPLIVSRWAGIGRDSVTLAPKAAAGSKHTIDLSALKKGVQYWLTDTHQEAWQRYRAYTPITIA